jgi:hypothetical protein
MEPARTTAKQRTSVGVFHTGAPTKMLLRERKNALVLTKGQAL